MAGEANGRPKEIMKTQRQPNGHTIGQALPLPRPSAVTAIAAKTVNLGTWLLVWYTIITSLFRCPSSLGDLTNESPKVCRPYLKARNYASPYVEPYYNRYAASHVETVEPYYNKINEQVFIPVAEQGKRYYEQYGAERVQQAWKFSQQKWEKVLKPQVETAQTEVQKQYNSKLAPHVDKASAAAAPYMTASKDNVNEVYEKHILPTYGSVRPQLAKAYAHMYAIIVDTILPRVQSTWTSTAMFFNRTLWPKIRIMYGQNIEPQLVRIGERLGRYRDGKKMQAVMDESDETPLASSISSTATEMSSSVASAASSVPASATPSLSPEQEAEEIRAKMEADLKNWQQKFTKAADKGLEDLQERVKDITDRQIESQAHGTGNAIVVDLEETVTSEEARLKKQINAIVKRLSDDPAEADMSRPEQKLSKATRAAGLVVKEKAQALRSWRGAYNQETKSLIDAASTSTLEVIDSIRDVGLQEIGMKWSHMEGVTYKDWAKYNEVKKSFDEWHQKISAAAQSHPGLRASERASEEVEAKGMAIAEDAAKELGRLKGVGKWKIQAKDDSDDFSTRYRPSAAVKGAQKAKQMATSASESVIGTSHGTPEPISSIAKEKASDVASDISSAVIATEPGYAEQASSKASEAASTASGKASEAVQGSGTPATESIASAAKNKAQNLASNASGANIGTPQPAHESVASQASEKFGDASSAGSDSASLVSESVSSVASDASSSATPVARKASRKVYGGAMAAEVKEQKPIMDDVVNEGSTYSENIQSMVAQAGDTYADITKAVSEAIVGVTKTQGTIESASSVAEEQYSKALAAASSVLYGTEQGTSQSMTSAASERWAQAVAAASSMIYGTPAPVTRPAANAASSAYSDATRRAQEHYSHAMSIVSAQISGKPKPVHQEMFSSVENAYSDSLGAASSRLQDAIAAASTAIYGSRQQQVNSAANAKYSEAKAAASSQLESAKSAAGPTSKPGYEKFMSDASSRYASLVGAADSRRASATKAASEAIYGPSQGVMDSVSAVASSKLADSLSAASAQYESAKAAVGATPTPMHQQYLQGAQQQYYAGIGLAHERYSQFVESASNAIYGTPTPIHESLASVASERVYGTPTPAYQSILDSAQSKYNGAVAQASGQLDYLLTQASAAAGKKEKPVLQSLADSASSQYSSAVAEASSTLSFVSSVASAKAYGTSMGYAESIASAASEQVSSISAGASTAIVGSETPWSESVASQASQNWEALVVKASEQVYGAPTPFHASAYSQAGDYAAQATDAAAAQYAQVASLFSELVSGREPDFTESVANRLSSAFYTDAGFASATSYASGAYFSASSAVSGMFTPPATLEAIIEAANKEVNAAVEAASKGLYGTEKNTYEKATSAAAEAASKASEKVYGTPDSYLESAQKNVNDIAASASEAIASVIYGSTATGYTASATNAANQAYDIVADHVNDAVEKGKDAVGATRSKIREAVYGPEKAAEESARAKVLEAVEGAKKRMQELGASAGQAADAVQDTAGKAAGKVVGKNKDEL